MVFSAMKQDVQMHIKEKQNVHGADLFSFQKTDIRNAAQKNVQNLTIHRRHKMKTIESYKVNMPEYTMSYIHNDDASGIEEADVKAIDEYLQQYYDKAEAIDGHRAIKLIRVD